MLESFKKHGIIDSIYDIDGTGHRVVHGGEAIP
jgi:acetate kinase